MRPEDREAVIALLLRSEPWTTLGYSRTDWDRYFTPVPKERETLVVEQQGTVVGIAVLRRNFLMGDYLELFGVATDSRRTGIGKRLLAHVESMTFGRSKNLFACVSDFNRQARDFYKKQGYQEVGSVMGLLIPDSAEILIRKTTGPTREK
jgi:ribosomal protein S18 acetylase RimI-like enzyme